MSGISTPPQNSDHKVVAWIVAATLVIITFALYAVLAVTDAATDEEVNKFINLITVIVVPAVTALIVSPQIGQIQRNTNGSLSKRLDENATLSAERAADIITKRMNSEKKTPVKRAPAKKVAPATEQDI